LDVVEHAAGVGVADVAGEAVDPARGAVDDLRRAFFALLAKLASARAERLADGLDLLARLRRALVDLLANLVARLRLDLLRLLLDLLLGLRYDAALAALLRGFWRHRRRRPVGLVLRHRTPPLECKASRTPRPAR